MSLDPTFAWILRLSLAALFAAAALHKFRDRVDFAHSFEAYQVLPARAARTMAPLVPWVEIGVLALLLLRPSLGGLAALLLLSIYSLAIGLNLARGRRDIDCGCLGPVSDGRQPIAGWLLWRNGTLAAGAALLALLPTLPRTLHWVDLVSVVGAVWVLALLWTTLHRLAALATAPRTLGRST